MASILIKTSPTGEQVISHCAWCVPGESVKRFISNFPVLQGLPVTSGICKGCVKEATATAERISARLHKLATPIHETSRS